MFIGGWLGSGMTSIYNGFFRFPTLTYTLPANVVVEGVMITSAADTPSSWMSVGDGWVRGAAARALGASPGITAAGSSPSPR